MIRTSIVMKEESRLDRSAACRLVQEASAFACTLTLETPRGVVNAKSMLGLLSLAMNQPTSMTLVADGPDEEAASRRMAELMAR